MPQCYPQRLCWACLSHGRESLTWALAPGHFPLPRPGIWHHTKGSQDSRTYSPTRGISRPLSGGHLPCFGGAAFLSCSPSIKRVLTKSQNGNLGPLVSSPQPTSSAVSPIQSSGLPRRNSKTSRWLAVLRWPLASAQDFSRHKACCIDRTASLVCQSAACQGIVSRRVPEGSRLTPPTGCGVSP